MVPRRANPPGVLSQYDRCILPPLNVCQQRANNVEQTTVRVLNCPKWKGSVLEKHKARQVLPAYPKSEKIDAGKCAPPYPLILLPSLPVVRAKRESQSLNRAGCYSQFEAECKSFLASIQKILHKPVIVPLLYDLLPAPEFDRREHFALTKASQRNCDSYALHDAAWGKKSHAASFLAALIDLCFSYFSL